MYSIKDGSMKMNSIGIRVTPREIYYTIIDTHNDSSLTQKLSISAALENDVPRQLSLIRTTLSSIIYDYDVSYAGIKTAEGNAKSYNTFRIHIEGVVQELFADSTVISYFAGTINSLASRLRIPSKVVSGFLKGDNSIKINQWKSEWDKISNKEHKESLLAALAAFPWLEEGEKHA